MLNQSDFMIKQLSIPGIGKARALNIVYMDFRKIFDTVSCDILIG